MAARKAKRRADADRQAEEEAAARFLEEQERQMRTAVAKKDTSDDLFKAPEVTYGESIEEKALKNDQVHETLSFELFIVTFIGLMYTLLRRHT